MSDHLRFNPNMRDGHFSNWDAEAEHKFRIQYEWFVKITPDHWTELTGNSMLEAAAHYASHEAMVGNDAGEGWVTMSNDGETWDCWDEPEWDDEDHAKAGWFKFTYESEFIDDHIEEEP